MSETKAGRIRSIADVTVVDSDSHVTETLEDLKPYIEAENPEVLRYIESAKDPRRDIYSATRVTPAFGQTPAPEDDADPTELGEADYVHSPVRSPEPKITMQEEFGIDYSILTPGMNLNLATVNHDQTAVAIAQAYNDWICDEFLDADEDFYASLLVGHQKPDKAAEEIDRVADEKGFVGVTLPASGLIPPAGHEWFDPIYEAAQDHGLPVVMHSGNSGATDVFPVQRHWAETFLEDHAFTFPIESIWHLISMVSQGIPERFPDLEFVMQECGVEWLPWMKWRLDDHYLQNSRDIPILRRLPSEYIDDHFFFTSQPLGHTDNVEHLAKIIEIAGGDDVLLFSADHPHPDFDTPEELFSPLSMHLDDETVRGIMGETAVRIFDLK